MWESVQSPAMPGKFDNQAGDSGNVGRAGFCFDDYHNTSWDHCLHLYRWELETDATVLQRRQKQIDYGKCTPGYQCFLQQVPK